MAGLQDSNLTDSGDREVPSDYPDTGTPSLARNIIITKSVASGISYTTDQTMGQTTTINSLIFGGRGIGEGVLGSYVAATESFVPGGNFESSGDVALWTNTGIGDSAVLVPTYSTAQAFAGTGSLLLANGTKTDGNHYPQVTYTYSSAQDFMVWRYINAHFRNEAPAGGAVTRTISIRVQDTAGVIRVYSVSGLTNASPFNTTGWIQILGEIASPTSEVGTGFDSTSVSSISLRMQDSGNKTFTAIYWDNVKLVGALTLMPKIYTTGTSTQITLKPNLILTSGSSLYARIRNNDTTTKEFQLSARGVDT